MSLESKDLAPASSRSSLYAWAVVGLLTIAYACAFIDRQILNLLAPKIQKDFALTDVQTGLLLGPAFALFFAVAGLVFGRLADRGNRSRLIGFAIAAWSVLTAACGLAPSFLPLFAARMGVGVGEAAMAPSAVSLISDLFSPAKRAAPLALFNFGSNLGSGSAYLLGAAIIPAAPVLLPPLGLREPWQATFIYVGAPGLLIALLTLFVREPARTGRMAAVAKPPADWAFVLQRAPLYGLLIGGTTLMVMQGYSTGAWEASFYSRQFGWSTGFIGVALGFKVLIGAGTSTLCAGWLAQRLRRAGYADANLRTMLIGSALMIPAAILAWRMPDPRAIVFLSGVQVFAMTFALNLFGAALCDVTPNEKRGVVFSLYLLVSVIGGLGIGPPFVALLSQYVYHGDLARALSTSGALFTPLAFVLLFLSQRPFRRGLLDAAAWTQEPAA